MNNEEIWMPVKGYEDLYEVSNLGEVRSLNYLGKTKKTVVLKAGKDRRGYLLVGLCKDGKQKTHKVHRLVWEAFKGEIPDGMQINHLDECKTNNWLENLEVCTHKENMNYGTRNVRAGKAIAKAMIGKFVNHPSLSKAVNQIDKQTGEILNTFPSCMEAERQTGIANAHISACCLGKRKSAGGYVWRYAEVKDVY